LAEKFSGEKRQIDFVALEDEEHGLSACAPSGFPSCCC